MGRFRKRKMFATIPFRSVCFLCVLFGLAAAPAFAGNLQMIEKRIAELKAENEQALRQSGELPADGQVALRARARPDRDGGYRYSAYERTVSPPAGSSTVVPAGPEAVVPPAAAPPTPALEAGAAVAPRPYTVQLVSARDQERSLQVAVALKEIGEEAFTVPVVIPGKGEWTRICIGSYADMGQARAAVSRLRLRKFPDAFVIKTPFALLAGSGGRGELGATESALRAQGVLGYVVAEDDGAPPRHRLLIGAYGSRQEAQAAAARLGAAGLGGIAVVFR